MSQPNGVLDIGDLLLPSMEEEPHPEADLTAVSDIPTEWLSPQGVDSTADLESIPVQYAEDDSASITSLQPLITSRKRMKHNVYELFRSELPKYLSSMTPYAEVVLNLADMFDDLHDGVAEASARLHNVRIVASGAVQVVRLRRRRANMKELLSQLELIQCFLEKSDTAVEHLEKCRFAHAATMLGVRSLVETARPPRASSPPRQSTRVDNSSLSPTIQSPINSPRGSPSKHAEQEAAADRPESSTILVEQQTEEELTLQDSWLAGPAASVSLTHVGLSALQKWTKLKSHGSAVLSRYMHSTMHRQFEPSTFNAEQMMGLMDGLRALRMSAETAQRFAAEDFQVLLDGKLFTCCCSAVEKMQVGASFSRRAASKPGEMYESWEQLADHLERANEVERCTVAMVDGASNALCGALQIKKWCAKYCETNRPKTPPPEQRPPGTPPPTRRCTNVGDYVEVFALSIDNIASQKCLAALIAFVTRAQVSRLPLDSMFAVFRVVLFFLDGIAETCTDGSVRSTRQALSYQCSRMLRDTHEATTAEALVKVLALENFAPFFATVDDFPQLCPLPPRKLDDADEKEHVLELRRRFRDPDAAAPTPWSDLWDLQLGLVPSGHHKADDPLETASVNLQARLFEAFPIFTFSSFETCKRMLFFAAAAHRMPSAASDLMDSISYFACAYVWFMATHFVAATDSVSIEEESNVPSVHRMQAREIRQVALRTPAAGYPMFPGMPCHDWKARAALPAKLYAAKERATAVCSLEPVVFCHQLCLGALASGGNADFAVRHSTMSERMASFVKFCVGNALRRLAHNVFSGESVVSLVEKQRWDLGQRCYASGEPSPFVTTLLEQLRATHTKLRESYGDEVSKALHRTMEMVVFNSLCGFVEACSRIKKLSAAGKAQLLTDGLQLTQSVKTTWPHTTTRMIDYAVRYVRAMIGDVDDIVPFATQFHALYTSNQLVRLAEREGGSARKAEVEAVLRSCQHEDRIPFSLLD